MEPFTIRTRISKPEYAGLIVRIAYKHPLIVFISVIGLLAMICGILILTGVIPSRNDSDIPVMPFIMGLIVLMMPFTARLQARKLYNHNPRLHGEIIYTFSNDYIEFKGADFDGKFAWTNVIRIAEAGNFVLLYTSGQIAEVLRKEALSQDQLNYIRQKVWRR